MDVGRGRIGVDRLSDLYRLRLVDLYRLMTYIDLDVVFNLYNRSTYILL